MLVPLLLSVAFMTIVERKQLAAMQRRVGPNAVGYYGVLQPLLRAAVPSNRYWSWGYMPENLRVTGRV